jgi:hypothetical protein
MDSCRRNTLPWEGVRSQRKVTDEHSAKVMTVKSRLFMKSITIKYHKNALYRLFRLSIRINNSEIEIFPKQALTVENGAVSQMIFTALTRFGVAGEAAWGPTP